MKKLYQYPFSCIIQLLLCKIGIACHNPFRDECTPDFECCSPLHKERYWPRISASKLPIKDKMKLRRDKDKTYMLNLIANLVSL